MQALTASAVFALLTAGQPQGSWDLAKCRQSLLKENIVKWGHVCTPEHLEADLAKLRSHPLLKDLAPEAAREAAETGSAEASDEIRRVMADVEKRDAERQKEKERLEAALGPELKGAALLRHCEVYLRMEGIAVGSEPMPSIDAGDGLSLGNSAGTCMGYVAGIFESMLADKYTLPWPPYTSRPVICVPEAATHQQVIRIVVKFLRDHPERIHQYRRELVVEGIKAAFPCPSK